MAAFENITDMTTYFTAANTYTDNYLVFGLVCTVFLVVLMSSLRFGRERALISSSFSTILVMMILNIFGLMPFWMIAVALIILAIGLYMLILGKQSK